MRKSYPPNFKARVVLELLREEKSVSKLASEYGVHPTQLHRWRKQVIEGLPQLFLAQQDWQKAQAEYEEQVQELYAEIGRLTTQLAWLKKGLRLE